MAYPAKAILKTVRATNPGYSWLKVLSQLHSYFRREGIEIDDSFSRRQALTQLEVAITEDVVISSLQTAEYLDEAVQYPGRENECGFQNRKQGPCTHRDNNSALQHRASVFNTRSNVSSSPGGIGAINAMIASFETVRNPEKFSRDRFDCDECNDCHSTQPSYAKVDIAVRREKDPVIEWDSNDYLLAGAFPTLFMMGDDMLPQGSVSKSLINQAM
ncbi:hypothetical protein F442_03791 [Phytophthora nicotianae P10297]|uniref:Uncharacterized protein n=1 Tax=Phytophthora nicotianae P10297 TaxID=1317064 RepID=W2ZUJ3_PHYNI|nr:hypothetical protein F442_03791 [Phytophthora nicotianae P10297]